MLYSIINLLLEKNVCHISASSDAAVGPIALAKNIVKTEGPKGLYRGIAPNFMKVTQSINVFI